MRELGMGKDLKKKRNRFTKVESGLDKAINRVINKIEISKFIDQRERERERERERGEREKETEREREREKD